jgi:hypothetical protein
MPPSKPFGRRDSNSSSSYAEETIDEESSGGYHNRGKRGGAGGGGEEEEDPEEMEMRYGRLYEQRMNPFAEVTKIARKKRVVMFTCVRLRSSYHAGSIIHGTVLHLLHIFVNCYLFCLVKPSVAYRH